MTTITALPTPPSRADSTNFSTRGDAFLGALPTFVTEANAVGSEATAAAAAAAASASAAAASQSTASTAAAAVAAQSPVANAAAAAASAAAAAASAAAAAQTSGAVAATTLSASGAVSGVGFSAYLASPPAIGGTTPAAVAATTLSASGAVSGAGFSTYLASPPAIGGTAAAAVSATALSYSTTLTGGTGIVNLGSGQFYKDTSGKVGINVTPSASTDAKLQVTGGTSNASTLATSYSLATTVIVPKSTSGYSLAATSGAGDFPQLQVSAAGAAAGDLLLQPYGGNVGIGTSAPSAKLDVAGSIVVTSAALLGYGTGSGGTATQATSKSTAVTLNKPTGAITMNNAALTAGTSVFFDVNNSLVAATDNVLLTLSNFSALNYTIKCFVTAGKYTVILKNETAGSLSEAVVFNFAVFKGATS